MASPFHDEDNHGKVAQPKITDEEKLGLTSDKVVTLRAKWGYNEMPEIEISLWRVMLVQFMGTMPYMLEIAAIICIIVGDWPDFGIIVFMLLCNGFLGFHESMKAAESLAELTKKMEAKCACIRDGAAEQLLTRELLPGDVILLVGGLATPADVEWFEGDILQVNTAAMTGEPLPRKYGNSGEYGNLILCGTTIQAGEAYGIVRSTGIHTEIGGTNMDIAKDKTKTNVSVFEQRVLNIVQIIISITCIDVIIVFLVEGLGSAHDFDNKKDVDQDLLTCLSIIIAAIPIALPIVMNVTMALGAGMMATDHSAVVTSLPALQDICCMSVLCSDKTGTLTTARITIHAESVWCCGSFTKQDVAMYGGLGSNRDKKEDPIDRSVIQHFDKVLGTKGLDLTQQYTKVRSVGFNPIYKRVVWEYTHPTHGRITVAKGLATKVLDTADHGVDDAADQWKCEGFHELEPIVAKVDYDFGKAGYKTLGVAVKFNEKPWQFVGILPMLDPPRHDSESTVKNLKNAGINVKMITGDHLNIAKETCRLIGMGQNIHPGEATRDGTQARNELVLHADGFAQVLPKDKREVVLVLKDIYHFVVGMTGDGVNDAPALSAAQCGVAVDDATDAAKNASAIILTTPGLSAIYSAVVESRRIFRKLKAYVTYRFAASIQIVTVLTLLIYISQCSINALFIILLALFNDLTMLPIAYDRQQAGSLPENPDVGKILTAAAVLGSCETAFTMLFSYGAGPSGILVGDYHVTHCDTATQAIIWLQMFIATELLIFSARAPTYAWLSIAPSPALMISVFTGCMIASLIAGLSSSWSKLPVTDIVIVWVYCIMCVVVIDVVKVQMFEYFQENMEVLPDVEKPKQISHHDHHHGTSHASGDKARDDNTTRESAQVERLSEFANSKMDRMSQINPQLRESMTMSKQKKNRGNSNTDRDSMNGPASGRLSVSSTSNSHTADALRASLSTSIRPNVPANRANRK